MKDPLDHVLRSLPPWRKSDGRTECGRAESDVRQIITRDQFSAKVKEQGRQRSAMTTCMTCWERAGCGRDWAVDPVAIIQRESYADYGSRQVHGGAAENALRDEMLALAELAKRHEEEFDGLLKGIRQAVRLDDHRGRRKA